jgi:hypothetical protein
MSAPRIALLAAALLCGCAGTPRGSESAGAPGPKSRPLASYASDPFVPVNLYLNANEQAAGETGPLIEYAAQQLRDSGAFVRLDRGVQRWPITIQARYVLEQHVASGWRRFASVATFGLVRIPLAQKHVLVAEIFDEPDSIAALDLSAVVRDRVSPFAAGERERIERAAVDSLLERLLAEIAQRKLIPRWQMFQPEPPKKAKPKVRGRST